MNVTKTLLWIHKCPALTVVIDDCHANSLLIIHVAINRKRCQTTLAIRINDVISACTADVFSYLRTGSSCNWGINFDFSFYCFHSISRSTGVVSLVFDFLMF